MKPAHAGRSKEFDGRSRDELIAEAGLARQTAQKCRLASQGLLDSMLADTLKARAEELDAFAGQLERRAGRMEAV